MSSSLEAAGEPLCRVSGITFAYGDLRVLDDVSFSVQEGDLLGLMGPNGSGKTTLFGVLSGFLRPERGTITFAGSRIEKMAPHAVARLGLVRTFQQPRVFASGTVRQNLEWADSIADISRARAGVGDPVAADADEMLEATNLQSVIERPVTALTTGQLRYLGVLLALRTRPRLVLLDEPAAGLNAEESVGLGRLLHRVQRSGVTVVVVDHDMSFLMAVAERIIVLSNGRVLMEGSPDQVTRDSRVLQVYLGTRSELSASA